MRHTIFAIALSVVLVFAISSGASAQPAAANDPQLRQEVAQLLEKIHIKETVINSMRLMIDQLKSNGQTSKVPAGLLDAFAGKFDSLGSVLTDSLIPVYAKYYTIEEIRQLNKLYDAPVMQKSLRILPQITAESMEMGSRMGRETMTNVATEYLTAHPELAQDEDSSADTTPAPKKKKKAK